MFLFLELQQSDNWTEFQNFKNASFCAKKLLILFRVVISSFWSALISLFKILVQTRTLLFDW